MNKANTLKIYPNSLKFFFILFFLLFLQLNNLQAEENTFSVDYFVSQALQNDNQLLEIKSKIRETKSYLIELENTNGWVLEGGVSAGVVRDLDATVLEDDQYERKSGDLKLKKPLPFAYSESSRKGRIVQTKSEILALESDEDQRIRDLVKEIYSNYTNYEFSYNSLNTINTTIDIFKKKEKVLTEQLGQGESVKRDLFEVEKEIEEWNLKNDIFYRQLIYYYHQLLREENKNLSDHLTPIPFTPVPLSYSDYLAVDLPPFEDLLARTLKSDPQIAATQEKFDGIWKSGDYFGKSQLEAGVSIGPGYTSDNDGSEVSIGAGLSFSYPLKGREISKQKKIQRREQSLQLFFQKNERQREVERHLHVGVYELIEQKQRFKTADYTLRHSKEILRVLELKKKYLPEEIEGDPHIQVLNAEVDVCRKIIDLYETETRLAEAYFNIVALTNENFIPEKSIEPLNKDCAVWVWGDELFKDKEQREKFLEVAQIMGINRIYLGLSNSLRKDLLTDNSNKLAEFLFNLHKKNIKTELLLGENSWIFPDKRIDLIKIVEQWMKYQTKRPQSERWDGLHLDIEPHSTNILPANKKWADVKGEYFPYYLETIQLVWQTIENEIEIVLDKQKIESPDLEQYPFVETLQNSCQLNLDIPVWWDKEKVDDDLVLQTLLEYADGVVLMNYSDKENSQLTNPIYELQLSSINHKKLWVGYEYLGEKLGTLKNIIDFTEKHNSMSKKYFEIYPSYNGTAFHSYKDIQKVLFPEEDKTK